MSLKERDNPFAALWILSTAAVWLFAFFSLAAEGHDYTGDGQFTISDVSLVAREATVGWIEQETAKRSCEPKDSLQRFFETSDCKQLGQLKWPMALLGFAFVGAAVAFALTLLLQLWWRLTD